jgi:hypothetical protein
MSFKDQPLYEAFHVEGKFSVGFFARDGGVWPGGSFSITLRRFSEADPYGTRDPAKTLAETLTPRVEVFNDGFGALRAFDRLGGLRALERAKIRTRDDLSQILLDLGVRDDCDDPLPKAVA